MKLIDLVGQTLYYIVLLLSIEVLSLVVDNRTLKPRERRQIDVGDFMVPSKAAILSPQQRLAVYQFLSSGIY